MGVAVVTVAAGGLPVVDVTATKPALGLPVTEAVNGRGIPVTKVSLAVGGLPVTFVLAGNEWPAGGGGTTYATFNPSDRLGSTLTLSNGNLTATGASGVKGYVRTTGGPTTGKFYFEMVCSGGPFSGGEDQFGLATGSVALSSWWPGGGSGTGLWLSNGQMYVNNSGVLATLGAVSNGQTVCTAVDLVNKRFWQRINNGNWNNSGTADPATNVGGFDISGVFTGSVPAYVAVVFDDLGNTLTANFGASAFTYTVPSGFTAGWPI